MDIVETGMTDIGSDEVTLDMVAELLGHKALITQTLKAYEARLEDALEKGETVEGWKLVEKRANKKWLNEITAYEKLIRWFKQDEFTTRKLATPTQVMKLMGKDVSTKKKNIFDTLWETPETGTTLAPSKDPRPAVSSTADMDDLSEDY